MKVGPFPRRNAESGTPRAPKPYKYAGACTTQMAMVNQRVIWLIVLHYFCLGKIFGFLLMFKHLSFFVF